MKKSGNEDKICVCVGTVTDDIRLLEVPKLKVGICICNHVLMLSSCMFRISRRSERNASSLRIWE